MIIKTTGMLMALVALSNVAYAEKYDNSIDKTDSCYFTVTDRFFNGNASNDDQGFGEFNPNDFRFYHGGDWAGLQQKLSYIKGMGFTCLYITPVTDNWKGSYYRDGATWTSYHGYHPYDMSKTNANFGTKAELTALVSAAHTIELDVMIDQVYNHMGPSEVFPSYAFPHFSWDNFNHNGEVTDWDCQWCAENQDLLGLTDLKTSSEYVQDTTTTQTIGLYNDIGADGIRLDAVRHISKDDWNGLVSKIRSKVPGTSKEFILGEVMRKDGSVESIAKYIGPYTKSPANLDSVFNMMLYKTTRDMFDGGAGDLGATQYWQLLSGEFSDGYNLGNFVDNHDVNRFLCDHGNSWDKLKQAMSIQFSWPGFPIVYYGTEQGANGCADPYNREDMWGLGFNTNTSLYQHIKRLNAVRNSENISGLTATNGKAGIAIRSGTNFQERWGNSCMYAYERKTANNAQVALVMINACGSWQNMSNLNTDIGNGWHQETTYGTVWLDVVNGVINQWLAPYETLILEN